MERSKGRWEEEDGEEDGKSEKEEMKVRGGGQK